MGLDQYNHLANTENSKINMCYIFFHMLLSARGLPLTVQQKVVKRNRALRDLAQRRKVSGFSISLWSSRRSDIP